MSVRHLGFIGPALLLLAASQPPPPSGSIQHHAAQGATGVSAPIAQPIAKWPPCGSQNYGSSDDLCAQWKAADAAGEAARISWWQFIVGVLTLIAAGVAAWFAGEAAKHTKAGADEARRGADIAANATRAWVVCEKIVLDAPIEFSTVSGHGDRYQMSGKVMIRNNGAALAKSVMTTVDIVENGSSTGPRWISHPEDSMARYQAHKMPWPLGITLAPNTEAPLPFGWSGLDPNAPSLDQAKAGTFYFIGYIRYRDHHDRDCYTRFAFRPDGDSVKPWDGITVVPAGAFGEAI